MSEYTLIRNAGVDVKAERSERGHDVARIIVNDQFEHVFTPKSRVSRHLTEMTPETLAERLTGGTYFFIGNNLIDFRDGSYRGFVHPDAAIAELMSVIGYSTTDLRRPTNSSLTAGLALKKKWSDHGITVANIGQGGEFNGELSFKWSPFMSSVTAAFDIMRLVCLNGMEGMGNLLTRKIPLVNRWSEHLDMAQMYFANTVSGKVEDRLRQMTMQRASVSEVELVSSHARERIMNGIHSSQERERLRLIASAADPMFHLAGVYNDQVFNDKRLADQLPAHLNVFDVYNMATELVSHTGAAGTSTANGLDRFANQMLVDRPDLSARASRFDGNRVALAGFSDPNTAFFGGAIDDSALDDVDYDIEEDEDELYN